LHKEYSGDIRLSSSETHVKTLVSLDDVPVCRPDGTVLFRTGKQRIQQGDRVVILGENGAGKSQFIRLLCRAIHDGVETPGLRCSPSIVLGYADQQMTQLPDQETPFGYITSRFSLGDQRSRSLLAGAGFPVVQQSKPIGAFSLGQKARLGMLALRLTQPNFYLMDEPTNHVDIVGQEKLEAEILAQEATAILVSHDRSFVSAVGTRFLEIRRSCLIEVDAFC
jgi:ATPase subunit of ABC transporter with duplicated ATPase domains